MHSRGTTPLGSCRSPLILLAAPSVDATSHPDNAGLAEASYLPGIRFHPSAQERTSTRLLRAGLSVHGPASLAASSRLLLSVTAFEYVSNLAWPSCPHYAAKARFCQATRRISSDEERKFSKRSYPISRDML